MNNRIPDERIAHYTCRRASGAVSVDGDLEKPVWKQAEKSRPFVDLVSGEPAFLETRMGALWDDENLYVGFWIQEPAVRASLTERDSFIWFDNDVEVFIAGEDCYYEFEINAFNTVYEVLFIYQEALKRGSRFDVPEFDLYSRNVDVLSGFQDPTRYGKHPRGKRWAFMDYDFPGLKTAVKVDGRINDPGYIDKGWTVELAFPWKGLQKMYAGRVFPPKDGDTLRAAFFRFENLRFHGKSFGESVGWALNEHGVYDSHIPENFSCLHFSS
ncbi:MAG: carbohydrate-binding family 9-like protein [Spirochaetaceae bacterium]|jgi:hypothetical protein|nr:carbohydrate-binding family 9-like protein [Spirochaetaceae bacterium]